MKRKMLGLVVIDKRSDGGREIPTCDREIEEAERRRDRSGCGAVYSTHAKPACRAAQTGTARARSGDDACGAARADGAARAGRTGRIHVPQTARTGRRGPGPP